MIPAEERANMREWAKTAIHRRYNGYPDRIARMPLRLLDSYERLLKKLEKENGTRTDAES